MERISIGDVPRTSNGNIHASDVADGLDVIRPSQKACSALAAHQPLIHGKIYTPPGKSYTVRATSPFRRWRRPRTLLG
jgi:hypothetical protein